MFSAISLDPKTPAAPTSVAEAVKMTGSIANDLTQYADMLSSRLNEISTQSNKIEDELRSIKHDKEQAEESLLVNMDDPLPAIQQQQTPSAPPLQPQATTQLQIVENSHKSNEKLIKDLVENIMNKKLDQIKQTMISLPKKISHFNSMNAAAAAASQLSFNPSSINKKLAQLKNHINLNSGGAGAANNAGAGGRGATYSSPPSFANAFKLSYDIRLDTSFYQTLEHSLSIQVCKQNEIINNSLMDPLPPNAWMPPPNIADKAAINTLDQIR